MDGKNYISRSQDQTAITDKHSRYFEKEFWDLRENMLRQCMYSKQERDILQVHPHYELL